MIYLIGGAPRSGKTILAKRLSKSLAIPFYSTDDLEETIRDVTPEEEWQTKFPKTAIRKETGYSNDKMYSKFTPKEIARAYIEQSRVVWGKIEELTETEDCIVEGYHIHPELVPYLKEKMGDNNVRGVFLTRFDVKKIVDDATRFTSEGDWFVEQTKDKRTYPKIAEMIKEFSEYLEKEAKKHKSELINVDNQFESKLDEALNYLRE